MKWGPFEEGKGPGEDLIFLLRSFEVRGDGFEAVMAFRPGPMSRDKVVAMAKDALIRRRGEREFPALADLRFTKVPPLVGDRTIDIQEIDEIRPKLPAAYQWVCDESGSYAVRRSSRYGALIDGKGTFMERLKASGLLPGV